MADGQGRKRKTVFEVSQKRRKGVEERNKTRVILGESFIRWRALKTQNGLPTDASVAKFLLDSTVTSTPLTHTQWVRPQPPAVSTILEETLSDRDADFSVKGVEKMVTSSSSSGGCGEEMVLSQEEPRASTSADVGFIDENDYNSLQNSIIDWDPTWTPDMDTRSVSSSGEDETGESSSEEEEDKESASEEEPRKLDSDSDSEDQDYFPPICLRDLFGGLSCCYLEESVHDEPDDDLNKPETLTPPEAAAVLIEEDVIGKPASIVYHDVIKQLLDFLVLPIDRCSVKDRITKEPCSAAKPFEVSVKLRCTALIVEWVCPNGHTVWKWSSQRYFKFGMLAGDFMLGVNILLSGNNYRKTALLFKFMNMGMIDPKNFPQIQDKFCVDTIEDFWKKESDKRETGGNSVAMEKISFVNTMDNICKDLPNIKEFCTDANISISAMFSKKCVKHSLDILRRIVGPLLIWNRDISNHFWYCCKEAESYEAFMDLWTGVLHHVTGVHEWYFGACRHASLDEEAKQRSGSQKARQHIIDSSQIVLDARWLKNVPKYLSFRSTAELESFHNHILMYASKRFSFSPPVYKARIWLAGLDYNKPPQPKGTDTCRWHISVSIYLYGRLYSKRSKMWRLYTIKKQKEYRYIPDLQSAILHSRLLGCQRDVREKACETRRSTQAGALVWGPSTNNGGTAAQKASRGLGLLGANQKACNNGSAVFVLASKRTANL
ncbi:hypothetical protein WMY93_024378 [Mugilogobius chulae]|uniref:Uncharacterized protein n=1 Tax=Mugilogobius chulae TaxID=88201 RepID=A0AAW0N0F4_9GOBI